MDWLLFGFPGNENLTLQLSRQLQIPVGQATIRAFPDGETYVRIISDVKDKRIIVVLTLDHPDQKLLPLFFFSKTAHELGATTIGLVAPYLAYMRQDKQFQPGEAVTSRYFAALLSSLVDWVVTIDPHLHRWAGMQEIYQVPVSVIHAAPLLSQWVKAHINRPLLVGPDSESEQWVQQVAQEAGAPYLILEKERKGDRQVEIKGASVAGWEEYTPVLVDDIISTAKTMIVVVQQLLQAGFLPPVCLGVHPVFAGNSYPELLAAGAARVVTTDTIPHLSNGLQVAPLLVPVLQSFMAKEVKEREK